jgi:hypothetical protein
VASVKSWAATPVTAQPTLPAAGKLSRYTETDTPVESCLSLVKFKQAEMVGFVVEFGEVVSDRLKTKLSQLEKSE